MPPSPIIALTPGEPAGVGPDLCVALAAEPPAVPVVAIADAAMIAARAAQLGQQPRLPAYRPDAPPPAGLSIWHVAAPAPVKAGVLDAANAGYVIKSLELATDACLAGRFAALVTGPVHKGILNDAGIGFQGHTEFLAERSGSANVVMMLACRGLRVALATTHLPLSAVPRAITRGRLENTLEILHSALRDRFGIQQPRISVCGLNPHAGESGHFGREEIEVIAPVIEALKVRGMRLRGPLPADTAFIPSALSDTDAVLAMYHDQGLPVIKHRDFAHAVNLTLGLPFVRTSVDHGTALELAGTGRADASSLKAALKTAIELCGR